MVEIIRKAVKTGDMVQVCSPSNVTVDNLVERLVRGKVKVVRLGHPARVSAQLQKHSLHALLSSTARRTGWSGTSTGSWIKHWIGVGRERPGSSGARSRNSGKS